MNAVGPPACRETLLERLEPVGQTHLLAFWARLTSEQRQQLARQIAEIDVALVAQLREQCRTADLQKPDVSPWAALAARAEGPPAVRLDGEGLPGSFDEARALGEAALRAGQVGMILVAGGLGTRLGFDHPKGMLPAGPLSGRMLFAIIADRLRAVGQRYGREIPLYLMTSPATDDETRQCFAANGRFGLAADQVRFFCQGTMWALDIQANRILMEAPDRLFLGPDGHGGMLAALDRSGALAELEQRGIRHLFYGQIDNPLLQVCDPLLLGCHLVANSEMTTQAAPKRDPLERVGNVVSVDGRVQVIEYSDLPETAARQRMADGRLKLWAGNLAVHVFDVAFLRRMTGLPDALPFHEARKKVACIDDQGNRLEPDAPNGIRFERFIFDLLPAARNALVVEADPAEAFAPIKNAAGDATDTLATAQQAMIGQARRTLADAGATVAEEIAVEINPLWALDADEARRKLQAGMVIRQPTYFGPDGPSEI